MQLNTLGLQNTALDGVFLIQPERQTDLRGASHTSFSAPHYAAFGLSTRFVADRFTRAYQGSLYGVYYDRTAQQAQALHVTRGTLFCVAIDLRPRRQTFGKSVSFVLNDQTPQAYLAPGIGWGFAVLSDVADIQQKFTMLPVAEQTGGIVWNDPELNVQWPFQRPIVGTDEAHYPSVADVLAAIPRPQLQPVVR